MIILETERLIIRNWCEEDRDFFHAMTSDPVVMEFFPSLLEREKSDALLDRLYTMISTSGIGFYALEERESGALIGFTGLAKTDLEPFLRQDTMEIGWRLAQHAWGKGYVTEAAQACLAHAFDVHGQDEVVAFAVHNNHRSTAVMRRLGMVPQPERDFDHPKVPDSHPHLKRHVLYAISKAQWLNQYDKTNV